MQSNAAVRLEPSSPHSTLTTARLDDRPDLAGRRIALFSGNYNYVRDGANQTLNRLVAYLIGCGAMVRVYSPTTDTPAFDPSGTLVSVPSFSIPRRKEYRIALGMPRAIRQDVAAFDPHVVHLSAPDLLGWAALRWADANQVPAMATFHTRFETYLHYYGLGWLVPAALRSQRSFYARCAQVLVPTPCVAAALRQDRVIDDRVSPDQLGIFSRGVDRELFTPDRRSDDWRKGQGFSENEVAVSFLGRVVVEKGLEQFADAIDAVRALGCPVRPLVIGDGPAMGMIRTRLPDAVFTGYLTGEPLARALASSDIFVNPSVTEAFGNVTLEAMASGVAAVCADATGARTLVRQGETGYLVAPRDTSAYAHRIVELASVPGRRRQFGASARAASAEYSWGQILAGVAQRYVQLAASATPQAALRRASTSGRDGTPRPRHMSSAGPGTAAHIA